MLYFLNYKWYYDTRLIVVTIKGQSISQEGKKSLLNFL